jgi:Mn-dependent DtxR family transcriptional regulator
MDNELTLPYRTDWREMSRVLEYSKGKGADRSTLDARFGGGESLRETLNALEQLQLIDRDDTGDVRLTPFGDKLAYAPNESERRLVLIEALLGYRPYRIPLERAVDERMTLLDAPWLERIWQVDMRLGQPRNRVEEARTFFFRLADDGGLGSYRRGVRGQTTRLELVSDFVETVGGLIQELEERTSLLETAAEAAPAMPAFERKPRPPVDLRQPVRLVPAVREERPAAGSAAETMLSIQVDMSDWDLDKIESFLRMIGYLGED